MSDPRHGNRPRQPTEGPRAGPPVNPGARQPLSSGAEFAGVGLQMGAAIGFFALAGYWLDKWLGTSPWLLIGMVFLGAGAAFYAIYQRVIGRQRARAGDAKQPVKSLALFVLAATGAVGVLGAMLAFVFRHPMERRALVISGLLAIGVQLVTFTAARFADRKHMMTVWGFGVLLRFVTLVFYALVMLEPLGLPAPAALLSLATFLFVTTLIEPRLLST